MLDIKSKIEIKEDGIYFIADYDDYDVKKEVNDIIEKYSIQDINYSSIENAINKKEKNILLTSNTKGNLQKEKIELYISDDGLELKAKFFASLLDDEKLTKGDILNILEENSIKYGIDFEQIDNFLGTRDYEKEYILAKGISPKESKDGYIKFYVDIRAKKSLPTVLEDGSLDYKNLNLFEMVETNSILAERIEPIKGNNGMNIFGKELYAIIPKEAPNLPQGTNTFISEDGKKLISNQNGRVSYKEGKISIYPTLELPNGVNSSTGNINFNGNIFIKGEVLAGFTIKADGDIEINGSVEGADIKANGNIFITKGVHNGANIYSKKDIYAQFIENAQIYSERSIMFNYSLNSDIKCGISLKTIGKKSRIVGGNAIVGVNILVKYLGSPMYIKTNVNIGINPKLLERYNNLLEKAKSLYKRYEELEKIITALSKSDIDTLNEEKKRLFFDSAKEKLKIKKRLVVIKKDIALIRAVFEKKTGSLQVTDKIYGGTKIVINNAMLFIKEDIEGCIMKNINGKVKVCN